MDPQPRNCPFCEIIAGRSRAEIVGRTRDSVLFVPLNPVRAGHVLIVPREHVPDAAADPVIAARSAQDAAGWADRRGVAYNLITSGGRDATQTVYHLHWHYVPRGPGDDGLPLPWTPQGGGHWSARSGTRTESPT